jgi:hypothetical protein
MGEAHDYRIRMIIKLPEMVSTEIFALSSKMRGIPIYSVHEGHPCDVRSPSAPSLA